MPIPKIKKKKGQKLVYYLTSDLFSPPRNFGSSNPCASTALWYFQTIFLLLLLLVIFILLQWVYLPDASSYVILGSGIFIFF